MAIYLGPGGAGDATADATSQATLATTKAAEAAVSAANALASAATAFTAAANTIDFKTALNVEATTLPVGSAATVNYTPSNAKIIFGIPTLSSGSAGVSSFNTRAGAVTLSNTDVINALTYTPYSVANPAAYINAAGAPVQTVAGKVGTVTLNKNDVGLGSVDNTPDLSKPVSTVQQTAFDTKQNTLVSGTNIKTINGATILGSGDIVISGGGGGGVTAFNTRTGSVTLTSADVTSALAYTPYNSTNPSGYTSNIGTVTSVTGAGTVNGLTLTGTISSSGSLTLGGTLANVDLTTQVTNTLPIANGGTGATTAAGALTALGAYAATNPAGYTTNTGTVTSVTATAPVSSTGGTTPVLSMAAATALVDGYLTSANFTTFNSKQAALVSGTNIKTINGTSVLGSGDITVSGGGSSSITISNKTAAYTVVLSDLASVINCTSGTFTVGLTAAATLGSGFNCTIWNTSATATDVITIDPNSTETIDGYTTFILRRGEGCQIICNGTNWETGAKKVMRGYAENFAGGGNRPVASGALSLAMGENASASAQDAYAMGRTANASGQSGLALGTGTAASAVNGVAIGRNSTSQGSVATIGSGAMALGGSYASGVDSFAASVANNTSVYGAQGTNSVALGKSAKTTGVTSLAFGYFSVSSGNGSVAIGGYNGQGPIASAQSSVSIGDGSSSAIFGKYAYTGSCFVAAGDSQTGVLVLRKQSTTATAVVLTSDNGVASATNQVVLPDDSTYIFRGQLVARNTGADTDSKVWEFKGAIRRGTNAASTALIGTPSIDLIASDGSAWTFTLTADTANGGLAITVTGAAATSIRWVSTVTTTEVTG